MINNDKPIVVDFGNSLGVNKIDGDKYRQTIDYNLTCDADSPTAGLSLVLTTSNQSTFDTAAVNASMTGLGIRLSVDDSPGEFGKSYPVDIEHPPVLAAVPVKDPAVTLAAGSFTASATLQAVYQ